MTERAPVRFRFVFDVVWKAMLAFLIVSVLAGGLGYAVVYLILSAVRSAS